MYTLKYLFLYLRQVFFGKTMLRCPTFFMNFRSKTHPDSNTKIVINFLDNREGVLQKIIIIKKVKIQIFNMKFIQKHNLPIISKNKNKIGECSLILKR